MNRKPLKEYEFWFLVGSQFLYGPETLDKVAEHSQIIASGLDASDLLPCKVVYKATLKTPEEIEACIKEANYDDSCAGIIVWMHTFSPSKMWINGLSLLQKPYCHLHTQFNRNIPDQGIDMDFMNLNQSAHGDREHGFIAARMHLKRKIVVGYWEDEDVLQSIGKWMRSAMGAIASRNLKLVRFGDNMRNVAVTEGDKVGVQMQLGWQVNTWGVADLSKELERVTEKEIDEQMAKYHELYEFSTKDLETVRYQGREEIAMKRFLEREGAHAFSNTFEDLQSMRQLPGLASQDLMRQGYGYGGEGDWKVSAMTSIIKRMTEGMGGGTSFMEDYTYDLEKGKELSLGAHMLEVCPSIAQDRAKIEVHELGIGGKEPPARLVFEGHPGPAVLASLVDMGGRLRLIVQNIEVVKPIYKMPNLPVARVMWRPEPNLKVGSHLWILAGGAHHAVLSYDADAQMLEDWCEIMGIEYVHITKDTTVESLKQQLFLSDLAWKFM
ncbi:L-arabinose isomerase [Sphaerochaeta sp. PS]|uniref:L-arabinose isomerase n=1 Tax=Sphaerochaeta sp. PS TaxID=3076336 RepID=UPI0028A43A48|nr:L-arabinose isomerase [Sphaerochaeta sp. PS]MDT4763320.1 L-arabinose isomerase [Sphaerochaeta sp. PS]